MNQSTITMIHGQIGKYRQARSLQHVLVIIAICLFTSALSIPTAVVFAGPAQSNSQDAETAQPAQKAKVGEIAPDFTLKDLDGKEHTLSEYKGKLVVLEWYNPQCPYVKEQHTNGPLQTQGNKATEAGVVWLAINSSAPGKQGAGHDLNVKYRKKYAIEYPILDDNDGTVGTIYRARTTPHMYIINTDGILVYMGAIDNAPFGKTPKKEEFTNYVEVAIEAVQNDIDVPNATNRSYGCSVKYDRKESNRGKGKGRGKNKGNDQ